MTRVVMRASWDTRAGVLRRAVGIAAFALLAALAPAPAAHAHGVGMSQIELHVEDAHVEGEWVCHLRDARWAVGLDTTLADLAGFNDLRAHEAELRAYALARIELTGDSLPCPLTLTPAPMEWRPSVHSVAFHVVAECPHPPLRFGIHEEVLFDRDSTHRAYFMVYDSRTAHVGAIRHYERTVHFTVRQFRFLEVLGEFVLDGLRKSTQQLEGLLLVVALMLPIPLLRTNGDWTRRATLREAAGAAGPVLVALGLGYSATLALTYFGALRMPAVVEEVAIAVAIFAAAWNNLQPFLRPAWRLAFFLGLCWGPKLAGTLLNFSIPYRGRLLSLLAYNGGVEVGQLATALVAVPLFFAAARLKAYPRLIMGVASLAIAWLAAIWVLERAFSLRLFAH